MDIKVKHKFSFCRTIATIGICLLLGVMMSCFLSLWYLIHVPSILLTVGLCFFLLLGTYGTEFLKFIPDSLLTLFCTPVEPNPRYAEIAAYGSRYVIGGGVVTTLLALMSMVRNLSSPDQIGMAIMIGLLPSFYAVLISELFFAFVYKSYLDPQKIKESKPLPVRNAVLPIFIAGLIIVFFLLNLLSFPS